MTCSHVISPLPTPRPTTCATIVAWSIFPGVFLSFEKHTMLSVPRGTSRECIRIFLASSRAASFSPASCRCSSVAWRDVQMYTTRIRECNNELDHYRSKQFGPSFLLAFSSRDQYSLRYHIDNIFTQGQNSQGMFNAVLSERLRPTWSA